MRSEDALAPKYQLKNKVLSESELGQNYIDYYYALSAFIDEKEIDVSIALNTLKTMPSLTRQIEILVSEGHSNEVMLDENLYNSSLEIFDGLKSNSDNVNLNNALNDLEYDLSLFELKEKKLILNEL